jgi:hypothetical protein
MSGLSKLHAGFTRLEISGSFSFVPDASFVYLLEGRCGLKQRRSTFARNVNEGENNVISLHCLVSLELQH